MMGGSSETQATALVSLPLRAIRIPRLGLPKAALVHRRELGYLKDFACSCFRDGALMTNQFGYPDFMLVTAAELLEQQYADRAQLRPIYDAIISAAERCGEVVIQVRKTHVSLVAPRRTFARVQPAKTRVD